VQKRNGYYKAVTLAQVNEAARKYLRPGQGTIVIAGSFAAKAGS
jgi:predicted Zn-dependent peptidase